jgi:hypothetical protein
MMARLSFVTRSDRNIGKVFIRTDVRKVTRDTVNISTKVKSRQRERDQRVYIQFLIV